jgi:NAD(P)-dependent dehydrogenase (short-subunit alcohol dehydrogenase family)
MRERSPRLASLFNLTGKVAIVTGASRGIGAAIAAAPWRKRAPASCSPAASRRAWKPWPRRSRAQGGAADGNRRAHRRCGGGDGAGERNTIATYGGVDILVNNAATNPHFGPLLTAEESHWDKTFDVNVKGYLRMVKACVPAMQVRGGGKVINLASIAGKIPQPGMGVYCVSKAGVIMLTEVLAAELAPLNIQVNAIAPGFVKTKFSAAIWSNAAMNDAVLAGIPQQRMAEPEEIAGVTLYLASPASSFTTGATILVDGGQAVGSPLYALTNR